MKHQNQDAVVHDLTAQFQDQSLPDFVRVKNFNQRQSMMSKAVTESFAKAFHVDVVEQPNGVTLEGDANDVKKAKTVFHEILSLVRQNKKPDFDLVAELISQHKDDAEAPRGLKIRKKTVVPRNENQEKYLKEIDSHDMTFGLGSAGTGKTFLAVAKAVEGLENNAFKKLILCRPAVEAGEKIGFLPGDEQKKIDVYMRPLYDSLYEFYTPAEVDNKIKNKTIEVTALAFMRGRTLKDAFVILDEAQNTTVEQMKMFATRIGHGSKMVINGDESQNDLPRGITSGLVNILELVEKDPKYGMTRFAPRDVVRHGLVADLTAKYETRDAFYKAVANQNDKNVEQSQHHHKGGNGKDHSVEQTNVIAGLTPHAFR